MLNKIKITCFLSVFILCLFAESFILKGKVTAARSIVFPVIGKATYSNDFNAPRGDRKHNAIDILAKKGQSLVAAATGTIIDVQYPKPNWGYSVTIEDTAGYEYTYIHMNDDNPGTNDGKGGGMNAYAMDVEEGNKVIRGQHIGKVGDSGYSNGVSHLHFEMYSPSGAVMNPYTSLNEATRLSKPSTPIKQIYELLPFSHNRIGANIAMGNFDADSASELVVGAGKGGGPIVKIYDNNRTLLRSFYTHPADFRGGIDVAAGDVDGDGTDEIIVGTGSDGTPILRVFELDGTRIASFYAYSISFKGGVKVAAGDVDGDGTDEIITGPNKGMAPTVKVFELDRTLVRQFDAYSSTMKDGIDVTTGDVVGTAAEEIITVPGPGSGPYVIVRQLDGTIVDTFMAYSTSYRKGVRISAGDIRIGTGKAEILTLPTTGGSPRLKLFSSAGGLLSQIDSVETWWIGNYDVAAGNGISKSTAHTNRRPTIRAGIQ